MKRVISQLSAENIYQKGMSRLPKLIADFCAPSELTSLGQRGCQDHLHIRNASSGALPLYKHLITGFQTPDFLQWLFTPSSTSHHNAEKPSILQA